MYMNEKMHLIGNSAPETRVATVTLYQPRFLKCPKYVRVRGGYLHKFTRTYTLYYNIHIKYRIFFCFF